ncbi:hydroxyisourate hydrolase [Chania multitudinisentens RB-25]|uniref:5-hydroxyisourate hydrolase n=2 Tax=Chania TaxID=1745211 RepID=W0L9T9_9GAMM|nr:hydroxyisourate hydrolase [Chania multitudinisentens RB-25]
MAAIFAGSLLWWVGSIQAAEVQYQLSTHILDISQGRPASNVDIELYRLDREGKQETWRAVGQGTTDKDGRVKTFLEQQAGKDNAGIYKLKFLTQPYFKQQQQNSFYPFIEVVFQVDGSSHYHVPITLSNFGYSTYRGS